MTDRQEFQSKTWQLHPRLWLPGLRPVAVQCTILDYDPLPKFLERKRQLLDRMSSMTAAEAPMDDVGLRETYAESAWDAGFREVTGDRVFLLTDYAPQPEAPMTDSKGSASTTVQIQAVGIVSNSAAGTKWLLTKILHHRGKRYCWCVRFDVQPGAPSKVTLDLRNLIDLTKVN